MSARKKVTIVGGGQTGGMMAYRLAEKNICDIVIKDVPEFAQHHGKALDILQGASVAGFETSLIATDDWEPTAGSDVVVITSGAPRKPGMSREDLLRGNAEVVGEYAARNAARLSPNAVLIVFANPMDVMCHVAMNASGFPRERVIGQGGMLDSERFRTFLAMELGVSQRDIHAYVLGGHTDTTMVPIVSQARAGGIPVESLIPPDRLQEIVKRTMNGGAELVALYKTGSAFFAPAVATIAMVEAILLDEKRLMPCAVQLKGEYGVNGTFCGTIVKLGAGGAEQVYEVPVSPDEKERIVAAANATAELVKVVS
ncbi:MAG TPA: malate dehydrogenase [Dehalococcoidia bacterium]|nr:malate dehydrogenase [Dehalococcoidia bacterium]